MLTNVPQIWGGSTEFFSEFNAVRFRDWAIQSHKLSDFIAYLVYVRFSAWDVYFWTLGSRGGLAVIPSSNLRISSVSSLGASRNVSRSHLSDRWLWNQWKIRKEHGSRWYRLFFYNADTRIVPFISSPSSFCNFSKPGTTSCTLFLKPSN
jgi:hypothetical protein